MAASGQDSDSGALTPSSVLDLLPLTLNSRAVASGPESLDPYKCATETGTHMTCKLKTAVPTRGSLGGIETFQWDNGCLGVFPMEKSSNYILLRFHTYDFYVCYTFRNKSLFTESPSIFIQIDADAAGIYGVQTHSNVCS